jgi:hypothetical protein
MSQTVIEAAIASVIQKHADFDTTNTKTNDRRPLGKGLARVVYITYGTHREEELTIRYTNRIWTFFIDVLVPWKGEMYELLDRVAVETQKVVDTLAAWPKLDGTSGVTRAILSLSNTPDVMQTAKGRYRGRRHFLEVREAVTAARSE